LPTIGIGSPEKTKKEKPINLISAAEDKAKWIGKVGVKRQRHRKIEQNEYVRMESARLTRDDKIGLYCRLQGLKGDLADYNGTTAMPTPNEASKTNWVIVLDGQAFVLPQKHLVWENVYQGPDGRVHQMPLAQRGRRRSSVVSVASMDLHAIRHHSPKKSTRPQKRDSERRSSQKRTPQKRNSERRSPQKSKHDPESSLASDASTSIRKLSKLPSFPSSEDQRAFLAYRESVRTKAKDRVFEYGSTISRTGSPCTQSMMSSSTTQLKLQRRAERKKRKQAGDVQQQKDGACAVPVDETAARDLRQRMERLATSGRPSLRLATTSPKR
jgi:hypothetical protein